MPRSVIDPVARTIHLRDRAWPFEWEPAAATAAIELGTQRFELRELSWRQKRNLARAAQKLGAAADEALGTLLLEACVAGRADLPSDPDEREALTRLTAWFLADGSSVTWDPAQLARVTLDVCRSAQIAPQALDDMPASDVEALWQVARQDAPPAVPRSPEPDNGGFNRIVIVPDPHQADARSATLTAPAQQHGSALPTEAAPTGPTATQPEATLPPPRVRPTAVAEPPNRPGRDVQTWGGAAGRVRATRPAAAPYIRVRSLTRPAVDVAGPGAADRHVPGATPLAPTRSVDATRSGHPAVLFSARRQDPREQADAPPAAAVSTRPSSAVVRPADPARQVRAVATPDPVGEPGLSAARSSSPGPVSAPAGGALPQPDWNPFIDERDPFGDEPARTTSLLDGDAFADDLERAALDAGIDLEA